MNGDEGDEGIKISLSFSCLKRESGVHGFAFFGIRLVLVDPVSRGVRSGTTVPVVASGETMCTWECM